MVDKFSPIARAAFDALREGVIVFDPAGRVIYANAAARTVLEEECEPGGLRAQTLLPKLGRRGARITPLWSNGTKLGEAVILSGEQDANGGTLADQEREAIIDTLRATGGRLAESARRLGISRTTLWRRLKAYGLERSSLKA